ncbi:hypothetical protein KCU95_g605, partial [Aureobasidium melanogenum]
MKTTVPPSVEVALPTKVVLDPIETAVAEVVDKLDLDSPPAHTLALSQLEQSNPRGWVRPLFFFATPHGLDPLKAVEIFREGLRPTLRAIPALASEIVPFDDGKKPTGKIALRHGDFGTLIVKDLRGTDLNYEELRKQKFPQSKLEPDVLCTRGVFPKPDEQQPTFIPQLNIVDGGLILALNIHHSPFDAQGINEVLRVWSQNCRHQQDGDVPECSSLPVEQFERSAHNASHRPTAQSGRPEHHPELIIASDPIVFGETAMKETHKSRVYRVSPKALAQLKNDCTEPGEKKDWISTNDAVTALIWRSVIRAQVNLEHYPEDELSHHIVNVDLRLRSSPALSKSYPGGPMNYARAGMKLKDAYQSSDLALLARLIRGEVDKRTPQYVDSLITLIDNIPGYDHIVSASFPKLMKNDCLTSTWYKLDILELDWGHALGQIERVRFPKGGLFNGLTMIYPQVTAGEDKGMEIAIGLDKENFEKLELDPVWSKYAEKTDPGYDCM